MTNTPSSYIDFTKLDFSQLKSNFINFLKSQEKYKDYAFDGSNFNVLLDILSYNSYLNNFYLNMAGSEQYIDSAQLRESLTSIAKHLNYTAKSKKSSVAYVDLLFNIPANSNIQSITIPKFYKFNSLLNNTNLTFSTNNDIVIQPINQVYSVSNVAIYEGNIVTEYFQYNSNNRIYTLSSENIDINSLSVNVYIEPLDRATTFYPYKRAQSLFDINQTSNIYFVQTAFENQYAIEFGDSILGNQPLDNSTIEIKYRDCIGEEGNFASIFTKTIPISNIDAFSITTRQISSGGAERESIDSIRYNSPKFYSIQERAAIETDFKEIIKNNFPEIKDLISYGGEKLSSPQYGKIVISFKTYDDNLNSSQILKNKITNFIEPYTLNIDALIIDPEEFFIQVNSNVYYDSTITTLNNDQLKNLVVDNINTFSNNNLGNFRNNFIYSKFTTTIDNSDISIIGNDTQTKLIKRISPTIQTINTYDFSFYGELKHEENLYVLPKNHDQVITSTYFNYLHTDGITYNCYIGDDGIGNLGLYYIQNLSDRALLVNNIGTIDYYTGKTFISFEPISYIGSYISIFAEMKVNNYYANFHQIISLEISDVSINIIKSK